MLKENVDKSKDKSLHMYVNIDMCRYLDIYFTLYTLVGGLSTFIPYSYSYPVYYRFRKYFNQLLFLKCLRRRSATEPRVAARGHREASIPLVTVNPSPVSRRSCSFYLSPVLHWTKIFISIELKYFLGCPFENTENV